MLGKSFPAEIRRYQSCYLPAFSHGKLQVLAAAALVQHVCARRVGEDVHPYKKAPLEDQSASELPALLACRFQPVAEYQHPSLQISATRNGTELTQEPTAEASILDKLSKMHSCQWQCVCAQRCSLHCRALTQLLFFSLCSSSAFVSVVTFV